MGSLGFLTPFQFHASNDIVTRTSNFVDKQVASRMPVYQAAIEKVMRGKSLMIVPPYQYSLYMKARVSVDYV